MREKLLFIAKVSGYSLGLYAIWHPISQVYGFLLYHGLSNPYIKSLTLIPFISLIIATPKIKILKKAGIISIGVIVFLFIDFIAIQFQMDNVYKNPQPLLLTV